MESNKIRRLLSRIKREKYRGLSAEEEILLSTSYHAGIFTTDIANTFIECNRGLVTWIANKYIGRGVDFDDLHACGYAGVLHALGKFEPSRKLKFSTYAVPWVHQHMRRAVENTSFTVRLPSHVHDSMFQVRRAQDKYYSQNGAAPTIEELAVLTGFTEAKVTKTIEAMVTQPASLSTVIANKEMELGETLKIEDENIREVIRSGLSLEIQRVLSLVNNQEREVLIACLGLDGNEPLNRHQYARVVGVSHQRISQIWGTAIAKIREAKIDIEDLAP
jgi:RNA polymerase sigma factor (sigma-70 family)